MRDPRNCYQLKQGESLEQSLARLKISPNQHFLYLEDHKVLRACQGAELYFKSDILKYFKIPFPLKQTEVSTGYYIDVNSFKNISPQLIGKNFFLSIESNDLDKEIVESYLKRVGVTMDSDSSLSLSLKLLKKFDYPSNFPRTRAAFNSFGSAGLFVSVPPKKIYHYKLIIAVKNTETKKILIETKATALSNSSDSNSILRKLIYFSFYKESVFENIQKHQLLFFDSRIDPLFK